MGYGHQSGVFGFRRLSCLRRFDELRHLGLLRAYRDVWLSLVSLAFRSVAVTSLQVGLSVTGPVARLGVGGVAGLMTRPTRTTWFQARPRLSCSADGSTCFPFGALAVTPALIRSTGVLFASAAFATFHFAQPR